jgi:trehalose/maltose transport system substrate-binding protein
MMFSDQRSEMNEIIARIRAGRLTRRSFLERAVAVGLSSSAAVSLLEACGGSSNSSGGAGAAVNLVWQSEQDSSGAYQALVDTFNKTVGSKQGIHVTWNQGPSSTNDLLTKYFNMLRARNSSIDVMSVDIVYPAQLAASQWIKPITSSQWPTSEQQKYLPGPIQGCTYQGNLVAAPFRTDIGLLYYRTDIVSGPPQTWDELTTTAQKDASKAKYGYVWQGAQYEGLVCDFVEVLYGYNGSVLDKNDPTSVTVNSPEARQALDRMVSWVGTISPGAVTTYMEEPSRQVWQNGNSIYMRNWPYAYSLGNDKAQSKVAGKFDISSLPAGAAGGTGHSAIGGWNLAINAFSTHADQAWEFINYMLQPEAQKTTAIMASQTVTLQSIYDDQDVLQKQPLFAKLKPVLQNALPRPVSPKYTDVSDVIQRHVFQALKKQASPSDALSGLEADLQKIVKS